MLMYADLFIVANYLCTFCVDLCRFLLFFVYLKKSFSERKSMRSVSCSLLLLLFRFVCERAENKKESVINEGSKQDREEGKLTQNGRTEKERDSRIENRIDRAGRGGAGGQRNGGRCDRHHLPVLSTFIKASKTS